MKKRFLKATAVMTALTMLFSGCGSLFMENDMTVSLSSQGTEGVDEMLAQGMEPEEFEIEIYEEDRWSGDGRREILLQSTAVWSTMGKEPP